MKLEVHEHHFVTGPRSSAGYDKSGQWRETKFRHSHEGGSVPHKHADTGPSAFTQRKVTKQPTGEQFPIMYLEDWQKSFDLVCGDPTPVEWGTGGVLPTAERLIRTFRMKVRVIDGRSR